MSDNVQEIMAAAFAAVRDDLPKFEDIEAEPTFADDAWSAHTRGRAAAATVEALVYGLRDGIEKLNHDRLRRLSELKEEQLRAVCERLQNFKPHIAPAWSPEEVEALAVIWSDLRHEAQSEHE
jgi:hypothetical protein